MITRSGSNKFHGSVYEFFRDDSLDANDWFANRNGDPIPPLRRNNYGFTFGGPIIKNKTFFFVDYDGLRNSGLSTATAAVPTDLMERLLLSLRFTGRVSVVMQNGRVLKSGYEEGYFIQRDSGLDDEIAQKL